MVTIPLAASIALSATANAISTLYGMGVPINDYLDKHIKEMKSSETPTISRTGAILEMVKFGFGVGYLSPVVVIAAGQYLLGNTLSAIPTIATAATLTNPIAMTCAAVGAIYYGWGALSDSERNTILENLSKGMEIGVEFIKAIINFVIDTTKKLLSSKNFDEIKGYIGSAAALFGRTLDDVTHKLSDVVSDTVNVFLEKSGETIDSALELAVDAYTTVKDTTCKAADGTKEQFQKLMKRDSKS